MSIYGRLKAQLQEGMYQGNMHACILTVGRLAGGYNATGAIDHSDLAQLERDCINLATNTKEAERKWVDAVKYGSREPLTVTEYTKCETDAPISWTDKISTASNNKIVDHHWLENEDIPAPSKDFKKDTVTFLETLFQPSEFIGMTLSSFNPEDQPEKHIPKGNGIFNLTAGEVINRLKKFDYDIAPAVMSYNLSAGGWIRVNALDGKGIKDANVSSFRYCLLESDEGSLSKQYGILKKLELPIATLCHSGKKSLHAIVKIDATNFEDYRKRVEFVYKIASENGLTVDKQNRNPSRLTRLPGLVRGNNKQYLIATHIGQNSYKEWEDHINSINDELPDIETLSNLHEDIKLSEVLIDEVLREGHKMMIAGRSKAGKSYDLIELAIAIAEGVKWHDWQCSKGKVLYVNLEIDNSSFKKRIQDIYAKLGLKGDNANNIDIWNLRGKSAPLDQLTPKLIRRALSQRYKAIIIDPIYKILTGDENNASEMAKFCNQFDKICETLKSSVIYCHHHSKGSQGQKASHDRSSGSGVFSRDPDAVIDLIELEIDDKRRTQLENCMVCDAIVANLSHQVLDLIELDDRLVSKTLIMRSSSLNTDQEHKFIMAKVNEARESARNASAWRLEGTLREFATFKPRNSWFIWPIHTSSYSHLLDDAVASGEAPKKEPYEKKKPKEKSSIANDILLCSFDGEPTLSKLIEQTKQSKRMIMKRLSEAEYYVEDDKILKRAKS